MAYDVVEPPSSYALTWDDILGAYPVADDNEEDFCPICDEGEPCRVRIECDVDDIVSAIVTRYGSDKDRPVLKLAVLRWLYHTGKSTLTHSTFSLAL